MPLKEDELDEVIDIPWKKLLESMEDGKYYSINEMSQKIIGREIIGLEAIQKYLDPGKLTTAPIEYVLSNLTVYIVDVAYVQTVLTSLVAIGKLKVGLKDGMPYYCKK